MRKIMVIWDAWICFCYRCDCKTQLGSVNTVMQSLISKYKSNQTRPDLEPDSHLFLHKKYTECVCIDIYSFFTLITVTFRMFAQELVLLCCLYQTVWEWRTLTHKSLNFITPSLSLSPFLSHPCTLSLSVSLSESHQSSAHRCDTWELCVISLTAVSHWYRAYNLSVLSLYTS